MRQSSGKLRQLIGFLASSLLMLSLVCRGGFAFSQSQEPPQIPQLSSQPSFKNPFGQDAHVDPSVRRAQLESAKKLNLERQRRMVADADRIVKLAEEMDADVAKDDKHPASPTEAKKAAEIEKLAKGVKERMATAN